MTVEGFEALKSELKKLSGAERVKIAAEIEAAREHGDLRENAEYHAAKEKQAHIEARIRKIEEQLSDAEIIDPSKLGGERVKFGARVELEDLKSGKTTEYRIVGVEEADIDKGTISVASPLARALINHEIGDEVRVHVPGGVRTYEIADIKWK
jgi:transcription elongation factor GreA